MALRLQLEDNEIKEYRTWYSETEIENGPTIYKTKCGLAWKKRPDLCNECNHVDCAIKAVEHEILIGKFVAVMSIVGFILFTAVIIHNKDIKLTLIFSTYWAAIGIFYGLKWYNNSKIRKTLIEFRDRGTVNGIKAHRIDAKRDINGNKVAA